MKNKSSVCILVMELTLCPDGLGDRAGVTEAVRVDRSDNKEVNCVGEEPDNRVSLLLHVVCYGLPGAAHWLAAGQKVIKWVTAVWKHFITLKLCISCDH